MNFLGIDPGASGGFANLNQMGGNPLWEGWWVTFKTMPKTEKEIWGWVRAIPQFVHSGGKSSCNTVAVIEKVGGYVGMDQPGSAMFNFGVSYGGLRMALIAAGIPFHEVTPQAWQKALGISPRRKRKGTVEGESKTEWKNRLKTRAEELYPTLKITLATSDALLLAWYCREKRWR